MQPESNFLQSELDILQSMVMQQQKQMQQQEQIQQQIKQQESDDIETVAMLQQRDQRTIYATIPEEIFFCQPCGLRL